MRTRASSASMSVARGQRVDQRIGIVRVDDDGIGQLVDGAGELAEHQHAGLVGARRDELLGHQVHPVAEGGHDHHVRGTIQRDELVER